jgi:DNA-binding transcriptional LysR family regulator
VFDLEDLQTFVEVADAGGVSAAARRLGLDAGRETIRPNGDLRGRLRITVPVSFGTTHLAPVLAELARRHAQLHIRASYSDGYVDLIGAGVSDAR